MTLFSCSTRTASRKDVDDSTENTGDDAIKRDAGTVASRVWRDI